MIVGANTIGSTEGKVTIFVDGEEMSSIILLNTSTKTALRYKKDARGNYMTNNGEMVEENIKFTTAKVIFDNVIIEVN